MPASMITPASSGRIAAVIMICQPAWQLAMTIGLPSASGWRFGDLLEEDRLGAADVLDRLPRNRLRQEADEIDRVAGAQRHADFAVGLHAADPGTVPGARIDDDDRRLRRIDRHVRRRDDAHQRVVDRPLQRPAVEHDFGGKLSTCGASLAACATLDVAAFVERLEKQHAPLPRVGPVLRSCAEKIRILRHDRSSPAG